MYDVNMKTAIEIANDLLTRCAEVGDALTQLKLQKLVYYVQSWALAIESAPCFSDNIEAWDYGPVVYSLREEFRGHGRSPIPIPIPEIQFSDDPLIDSVLEVYGVHEGEKLIALTHLEQPWKSTYKPFHDRIVIENRVMQDYFSNSAVKEFEIHAQFLDVYRAKKFNVIGWEPQQLLSEVDILELEKSLVS